MAKRENIPKLWLTPADKKVEAIHTDEHKEETI